MGTRASRHGYGRKPFYKEHRQLLQDQADSILRASGDTSLIQHRELEHPQIFDPFIAFGERMRGVPKVAIYEPQAAPEYTKPKNRTMSKAMAAHYVCEGCGKPRSYSSGRMCRACYGLKVLRNHEARVQKKWARIDGHYERFSWLVEHYIEYWVEFFRYAPNFAERLVDDISRWEEHMQLPYVFWNDALQYQAVEDARELPERMELPRRANPRPRQNVTRMRQSAWRYQDPISSTRADR